MAATRKHFLNAFIFLLIMQSSACRSAGDGTTAQGNSLDGASRLGANENNPKPRATSAPGVNKAAAVAAAGALERGGKNSSVASTTSSATVCYVEFLENQLPDLKACKNYGHYYQNSFIFTNDLFECLVWQKIWVTVIPWLGLAIAAGFLVILGFWIYDIYRKFRVLNMRRKIGLKLADQQKYKHLGLDITRELHRIGEQQDNYDDDNKVPTITIGCSNAERRG